MNWSLAFSCPSDSLIVFTVRSYWLFRYPPFLWLDVVIALVYFLRQWNQIFSSNPPKNTSKAIAIPHVLKTKALFKEMRHLHQASLLCSRWYGIFCFFACWFNFDISVPYSLPLLIEKLHSQMVCPEALWQRFCRWIDRLCAPLQCKCLKEHLQLFHPPALNRGPQSWYNSYLWFSYK